MFALDDVASGISDFSAGLTAAIDTDLAQAKANAAMSGASSAAGGEFYADLAALYDYYNNVKSTFHELQTHMNSVGDGTVVMDSMVDTISSIFGGLTELPGVSKSINATLSNAVSTTDSSMYVGLKAVQAALAKHLNALATVYQKYIAADDESAAALYAASGQGSTTYSPDGASGSGEGTVAGGVVNGRKKSDDGPAGSQTDKPRLA
jgi:hypothetical protein